MSVGDLYDVGRTGEFAVAPTRIRPRQTARPAPVERAHAGASGSVPITVLTTDPALADAIHDAAGSAHPVATATTADEAIELAAHGRCGILITDQIATQPVLRRMIQRLREAEPALVVIAVGGTGDQSGLISLLSAGIVDRLMLKPIMPALAQIVLKSAAQQHRTLQGPGTAVTLIEQREPAVVLVELQRHAANGLTEARPDLQPSPAEIVVPASMVTSAKTSRRIDIPRPPWIAVVAALLAVVGLMWWMAAERKPAIDAQAVIASHLAAGQRAFREGHVLEPRGQSALDYYNTVLALDPANVAARQGVDQIADRFAAQAGSAIARGQIAAALVAVESVRRVRPAHRQLSELQARLDDAQEKYAARVPEASAPAVQPPPKAAPAPASVLSASLQQNVIEARARTVAQAAEALQRDQLELASALLSEARTLGVPAAELTAMNQALASAQQLRAKDDLLQRVLQRTAENKLLEPAEDSAKFHLQRLVELDAKFAGIPAAVAALGGRLTLDAQLATAEKNFDLAARLLAQAREIGFSGAEMESAEAKLAAALKPVEPSPLPTPRISRMVRPEYPQDALVSGAEGWVNVHLSITPAGNVLDPRVVETSNGTLFNSAALAAVRKWKYEPFAAADPQATRDLTVRLDFRMKGRR